MEGTLWKWTNYFSGWQPRWFVLDDGILSYYKSQEDVNSGCKGSIKMTVCDVVVHQTDNTRLDLIIPGEQHFYVKAATPQERQQWLVALGSSKACTANGTPPADTGELSPDNLRTKKSELRLYCDVLMQRVHAVKTAATASDTPDIEQLDDATSLLSATCDAFIQTLEDCMKLAHAKIVHHTPLTPQSPGSALPPSPLRVSHKKSSRNSVHRSSSSESVSAMRQRGESQSSYSRQSSRSSVNSETSQQPSPNPLKISSNPTHLHNHNCSSHPEESVVSIATNRIPTFFSNMSSSFVDIRFQEDGEIPVEHFLQSCQSLVPLFDCLHGTAFAPVKMDYIGNIRKMEEKHKSNPTEFTSLQKMVLHEIKLKQYQHSSSATVALLWMKRSLEFMRMLLQELSDGQEELLTCITNAYGKTLRNYHSWVVRGVFALAVKAVPYRDQFIKKLAIDENDAEHPEFHKLLYCDIDEYITALDVLLKILQDFYSANDLDDEEKV
ncbi:pleckstrin homology domain-containing family A member 8-like [Liolophura sinensis]|uniref:pleckstrin homology domain-containing family A member 8-like n=1 Tax=Liolophura sinensis TaxID=3198878 RepID=UPI0031580A8E